MRASEGLASGNRKPRVCDESIEHVATPTFFRDRQSARATGRVIAARLILMNVWRDS